MPLLMHSRPAVVRCVDCWTRSCLLGTAVRFGSFAVGKSQLSQLAAGISHAMQLQQACLDPAEKINCHLQSIRHCLHEGHVYVRTTVRLYFAVVQMTSPDYLSNGGSDVAASKDVGCQPASTKQRSLGV